MSSVEAKIDALILAGTKNYPKMKYSGGEECKPFIPILGKTLVEYVIEAALGSERIRRVYVVTDAERLEGILKCRGFSDDRLRTVPDQDGLISNIRSAVYRDVLVDAGYPPFDYANMRRERYLENHPSAADHEVLLLFSDAPFITGEDITRFIDTSDRTADYVVGLSHEDALLRAEHDVSAELCCPELKTALFPLDTTNLRGNNMFLGKPLRVPSQIWDIAQKIYDNRHLLKAKLKKEGDDEENHDRWKNIVRIFWDYTMKNSNRAAVVRGFAKGLFCFWQFYRARKKDSISARLFLGKQDFEGAGYDVTGRSLRGSINITDVALPTFDVDNEEMLKRLTENDCSLFKRLQSAPRHYKDDPEKDLEEFVSKYPALFISDSEIEVPEWNRMVELYTDR